jgi:hypothetical protein
MGSFEYSKAYPHEEKPFNAWTAACDTLVKVVTLGVFYKPSKPSRVYLRSVKPFIFLNSQPLT